jgi:hypothetical protein
MHQSSRDARPRRILAALTAALLLAAPCLAGCAPTAGGPAGNGGQKRDAGKAGETIEVIEILEESAPAPAPPTVETTRLPADE